MPLNAQKDASSLSKEGELLIEGERVKPFVQFIISRKELDSVAIMKDSLFKESSEDPDDLLGRITHPIESELFE